jgi:hypothetical protein
MSCASLLPDLPLLSRETPSCLAACALRLIDSFYQQYGNFARCPFLKDLVGGIYPRTRYILLVYPTYTNVAKTKTIKSTKTLKHVTSKGKMMYTLENFPHIQRDRGQQPN